MIERFNFYDVYGYLLPGVLLLGLVWFPIGLTTAALPSAAWSSAVVALALAYVVGHLLANLSSAAFPSLIRDKQGRKRAPSDLLFDRPEDEVLSQRLYDLKEPIAEQIRKDFGIDVEPNAIWAPGLKGRRGAAFLQCRKVLIHEKNAAYAEQQEGMYVLMRGCAAAFVLACALYLGLAIGSRYRETLPAARQLSLAFFVCILVALVFGFIALAFQRRPAGDERGPRAVVFWSIAAAFAFAGLIAGDQLQISNGTADALTHLEKTLMQQTDPTKFVAAERAVNRWRIREQIQLHLPILMLGAAGTVAILVPICLAAYRAFAVNFAVTVYRDYYGTAALRYSGTSGAANPNAAKTQDVDLNIRLLLAARGGNRKT